MSLLANYHNMQDSQNLYSPTPSEGQNAVLPLMQDYTPEKGISHGRYIHNVARQRSDSSSSEDSEDNIPLQNLREQNKSLKSPFQQLIPTPNYAVVKQNKPKRKAFNYKGQRVTRDLFMERETKKKRLKRQQTPKGGKKKKEKKKNKGNPEDTW